MKMIIRNRPPLHNKFLGNSVDKMDGDESQIQPGSQQYWDKIIGKLKNHLYSPPLLTLVHVLFRNHIIIYFCEIVKDIYFPAMDALPLACTGQERPLPPLCLQASPSAHVPSPFHPSR